MSKFLVLCIMISLGLLGCSEDRSAITGEPTEVWSCFFCHSHAPATHSDTSFPFVIPDETVIQQKSLYSAQD